MHVADALTTAPCIYANVGLSIGWGPKKAELVLPTDCDPEKLPIPRNPRGEPLPDIVHGFKACLGIPRHPANDVEFILAALQQIADHQDNLLELVGDVSEEYPFVALRLLQVCAVNRFEHILSAGPPEAASLFAEQRDLAITNVLAVVQGFPVDPATTTHDLPMVAGWAGLPPLQRIAFASYLGAFFRVAEPLVHRLMQMRGTTTSMVAGLLEDPT